MKMTGEVQLPTGPLVSMSVSPDGKLALVSAEDTLFVVSIPDRKLLRQFKTPKGAAPKPVLVFTAPGR